jgi:hypothetical protein
MNRSMPLRSKPVDSFDNPAATCLTCGWEGTLADTGDELAGCKCPDCRHRARCPECAKTGLLSLVDLTPAPAIEQSPRL